MSAWTRQCGGWKSLVMGVCIAGGCAPRPATNLGAAPPGSEQTAKDSSFKARRGPAPSEPNICMEAQRRRVPVIMYHDLMAERTKESLWYDCSVEEFRAQMEAIQLAGYTVISTEQLYNHLTKGEAVPEKSIVLTFDDNYQSFYDLAWPILKEYDYPVTMFVHTAFVGKTEGRPKMDWDTLRQLTKDKNFTIGAHTVNHYLDLAERDLATQREEIEASVRDIKENLGIDTPWLAYPNGSNSDETQILAQSAGLKMAFTIVNEPAEESPNIFAVGRYVHTKFGAALRDREDSIDGAPAAIARFKWSPSKQVTYKTGKFNDVDLKLVIGGRPTSSMSPTGREPVQAFVDRAKGVAGINGGFFAMAAVASNDNQMVGPLKTSTDLEVIPDNSPDRWSKILNRPLVVWSDEEFAILPYIPAQMRHEEQFSYFMRDYTDCFMAGVWLVHAGVPRLREFQDQFGAKDIQDYRRRAFIGITAEGEFVAGAATESVSSEKLAFAVAEAGVEEAVLLDSGFSTSLVFNGAVVASGHSNKNHPSRPVPHAIAIVGEVDLANSDPVEALPAIREEAPRKASRRRFKRR